MEGLQAACYGMRRDDRKPIRGCRVSAGREVGWLRFIRHKWLEQVVATTDQVGLIISSRGQ